MKITFTEYSLKTVLIFLFFYAMGVGVYFSSRENRRPGEEHGSAKWGVVSQIVKRYADHKERFNNLLFSQTMRIGLNAKKHRRNLNVLVVGGSGAGKTRFYAKPNIMQCNTSFIIADPKGEMLRSVAPLLLEKGYDVKVFNLITPSNSDGYNPFTYIRTDEDVIKLITNLIQNTTPKNAQQNDPFWEKSEIALDTALMLYLLHEAPPEEQNFEMLMFLIENAAAMEDDDEYQSPVDLLFQGLEDENPEHIALKQYKIFKQASGKTAKSILISAAVRLAAFNLPEIARMTSYDNLDLGSMGEKKKAIFCVIPDNDNSFNYTHNKQGKYFRESLSFEIDEVVDMSEIVSDLKEGEFVSNKRNEVMNTQTNTEGFAVFYTSLEERTDENGKAEVYKYVLTVKYVSAEIKPIENLLVRYIPEVYDEEGNIKTPREFVITIDETVEIPKGGKIQVYIFDNELSHYVQNVKVRFVTETEKSIDAPKEESTETEQSQENQAKNNLLEAIKKIKSKIWR